MGNIQQDWLTNEILQKSKYVNQVGMDYSIVIKFSTWLSIYFHSINNTLGTRM